MNNLDNRRDELEKRKEILQKNIESIENEIRELDNSKYGESSFGDNGSFLDNFNSFGTDSSAESLGWKDSFDLFMG